MKLKRLVILLMTFLCCSTLKAGGPLQLDNGGTITLSQDALDIARFGCLTRPACGPNFVLSNTPCEGEWESCYVCELRRDLHRAISCPAGWVFLSLDSSGYICSSTSFAQCSQRFESDERMRCLALLSSTELQDAAKCPEGFVKHFESNHQFRCDFEDASQGNICTQCLHRLYANLREAPDIEENRRDQGFFQCANGNGRRPFAGSGGSGTAPTDTGGVPAKGTGGTFGKEGSGGTNHEGARPCNKSELLSSGCMDDGDPCTIEACKFTVGIGTTCSRAYDTVSAACIRGTPPKGYGGTMAAPLKGTGGSSGKSGTGESGSGGSSPPKAIPHKK